MSYPRRAMFFAISLVILATPSLYADSVVSSAVRASAAEKVAEFDVHPEADEAKGHLRLTLTPSDFHHMNTDATAKAVDAISGETWVALPENKLFQYILIEVQGLTKRTLEVYAVICDNDNTYCKRHHETVNWDPSHRAD